MATCGTDLAPHLKLSFCCPPCVPPLLWPHSVVLLLLTQAEWEQPVSPRTRLSISDIMIHRGKNSFIYLFIYCKQRSWL